MFKSQILVSYNAYKEGEYQAQMYLQPHYGNGVFANVYLSLGQQKEVNIARIPLL